MGFPIAKWQDCNRCGAKLAVKFGEFVYDQPCDDCKNTKEWEEEHKRDVSERKNRRKMDDMLQVGKPKAVFTVAGRDLTVDNTGQVIKEEAHRESDTPLLPTKRK
jgi:hypothetical protein